MLFRSLTLDKQGQIEILTFQHFLNLKEICDSEQQKKLQLLMHRLLPQPMGNREAPPLHLGEQPLRRSLRTGDEMKPPPPPGNQ